MENFESGANVLENGATSTGDVSTYAKTLAQVAEDMKVIRKRLVESTNRHVITLKSIHASAASSSLVAKTTRDTARYPIAMRPPGSGIDNDIMPMNYPNSSAVLSSINESNKAENSNSSNNDPKAAPIKVQASATVKGIAKPVAKPVVKASTIESEAKDPIASKSIPDKAPEIATASISKGNVSHSNSTKTVSKEIPARSGAQINNNASPNTETIQRKDIIAFRYILKQVENDYDFVGALIRGLTKFQLTGADTDNVAQSNSRYYNLLHDLKEPYKNAFTPAQLGGVSIGWIKEICDRYKHI